MTTNRREFIAATGATIAALSGLPACGRREPVPDVASQLADLAEDLLVDYPENATALGIDLDVVRTAHETAAEGFRFPYGDVAQLNSNWSWRNAPYVVAQNTGAFLEIPGLLEEQHAVASREDAEAYLARRSEVATWPMIASFACKTRDIPGNWAGQAAKIAADRIPPALASTRPTSRDWPG
jgi:hypothetical protein